MLIARTYKNTLLRNLSAESIERLRLHPVTFELLHEIEFPGDPIKHLLFVEEGMAAMATTFDDGSQVGVGMYGYESVIGVSALLGTKRSYRRIYTQIAGSGYSSPVEAAIQEFQRGGDFQTLALRYVDVQLVQAAQSAACNAKHSVEQRLARWLLHCVNRVHSDTYALSHDSLADMLGSSRPTITLAAGLFKERKLIEYSRGVMRIIDIEGLEKRACECSRILKDYCDDYTKTLPDALGIAKKVPSSSIPLLSEVALRTGSPATPLG